MAGFRAPGVKAAASKQPAVAENTGRVGRNKTNTH